MKEGNFDRHYCPDLSADFLYSSCFYEIGKRIGRDGKQCNDAPHGIDSDGDCGGMFRQRIETDFGDIVREGMLP